MNAFEELVRKLRGVKRYTAGSITDLLDDAADVIELLNDYALALIKDIDKLKAQIDTAETYAEYWEKAAQDCKARFEELVDKIPRWISVKDRLPETCGQVLVCIHWGPDDNEITVGEYWGTSMIPSESGWGSVDPLVTHWQPLPEPPKEETE